MSEPTDPAGKLVALWSQAAQGAAEAVTAFWQATPTPATGVAVAEAWSSWAQAVFAGAPDELARAWSAKAFTQPGAAPANWAEAMMGQMQAAFAEAGPPPNPERMQSLWSSAWAEFQGDLGGMPDDAFWVDFGPLAAAWQAVASGAASPQERRVVDRFVQALAVKSRLGPEYYADPEQVAVAPTPRSRRFAQDRIELFQYDAEPGSRRGAPVLIVYSVINRSYILDLCEGSSFVQHLLDEGLDVWMVEWNGAVSGDRDTTLDRYIDPGLSACVAHIQEATGAPRVSLMGHCIGGTLAAMYAALHPDSVERFLLLTVPFGEAEGGVVALATDSSVFDVDAIVARHGHMPAKLIRYTFVGLKPYYELMKWKLFVEGLGDDVAMERFAVVDRWANDNVDIPAEVFRKYIDEVFHSGRLLRGETEIGGRRVELSNITCPTLNLAGSADWIVPPDAARPFSEQVGGEASFVEMPGSHLSVVLDPRLRSWWARMSGFLLGPDLPA